MNELNSVESVLKIMMKIHPEYKLQLKEALDCYQYPFKTFCENEAKYRLDEHLENMECPAAMRNEMEELLAEDLFASETFCDGDVAYTIASNIISQIACDVSEEKGYQKYINAIHEGRNVLLLVDETTDKKLTSLLCEVYKIDSCTYKELLYKEFTVYEEKISSYITLGVAIKLAEKVLQDWEEKDFARKISADDHTHPWRKESEQGWIKKISETEFALIEIRNSLEIEYNLCGGVLNINCFKQHWEELLAPKYGCYSDFLKMCPPENRNQTIAATIFKRLDSGSLYCLGPYANEKEAKEAVHRILKVEEPSKKSPMDRCKGCMGAAFGDCDRCPSI